ncbi:MAG: hypothetical protein FWH32_02105 [Clostridiales bacterium]|nr:hypothetical protein [Clostridiales bacterium]
MKQADVRKKLILVLMVILAVALSGCEGNTTSPQPTILNEPENAVETELVEAEPEVESDQESRTETVRFGELQFKLLAGIVSNRTKDEDSLSFILSSSFNSTEIAMLSVKYSDESMMEIIASHPDGSEFTIGTFPAYEVIIKSENIEIFFLYVEIDSQVYSLTYSAPVASADNGLNMDALMLNLQYDAIKNTIERATGDIEAAPEISWKTAYFDRIVFEVGRNWFSTTQTTGSVKADVYLISEPEIYDSTLTVSSMPLNISLLGIDGNIASGNLKGGEKFVVNELQAYEISEQAGDSQKNTIFVQKESDMYVFLFSLDANDDAVTVNSIYDYIKNSIR